MIVLDNEDKIQGDASAATVVDYTLHGMVGTTLTQLADGQMAATKTDMYTASGIVVVSAITLVNTDTSARTVNLYLLPSAGTARRIIAKSLILEAGFSLHYDGVKVNILSITGGIVTYADVSFATASEIDTGTVTTKANTPDALAGSIFGTKDAIIKVIADGTALTTGDGKSHFTIPAEFNGMNLVSVGAHVYTVSSSGTPTFQIHNLTKAVDMLSTVITIDASEKDSKDAAIPAVINTANDDVSTGDEIRFDCDAAGTGAKGMEIRMGFRKP